MARPIYDRNAPSDGRTNNVNKDNDNLTLLLLSLTSISLNGNGIFRSIPYERTRPNPSRDSLAFHYQSNTSTNTTGAPVAALHSRRCRLQLTTNDNNKVTADNFQTRHPNAMKLCVREAHPPPLPNGTINIPKATKIFKHLNSPWVQFSRKMTKINAD